MNAHYYYFKQENACYRNMLNIVLTHAWCLEATTTTHSNKIGLFVETTEIVVAHAPAARMVNGLTW